MTLKRTEKEKSVRGGQEPIKRTRSLLERLIHTVPLHKTTPVFLTTIGMRSTAEKEYTNFVHRHIIWVFDELPEKFNGWKLLQLSDLHADLSPTFAESLSQSLQYVKADACAITGDFQDRPKDSPHKTVEALRTILRPLKMPIYGIPGNHDTLQTVEAVQTTGVEMLINRSTPIKSGGDTIHLCGVDDPHFYQTHDLQAAGGPGFRILLAHSPEIYKEAAEENFALCLSGHTHAGQIQLPGLGALMGKSGIPRAMFHGKWKSKNLSGFTSAGTGSSAVPLRLNCRPEIITHEFYTPNGATQKTKERLKHAKNTREW